MIAIVQAIGDSDGTTRGEFGDPHPVGPGKTSISGGRCVAGSDLDGQDGIDDDVVPV
jgi:hypothetical protein